MKNAWLFAVVLVKTLGIFSLHLLVGYVLPTPFNYINVIVVFLMWFTMRQGSYPTIWYAFGLGFLSELFSADTFGVVTLGLMVSVIAFNWLLQTVFSNHSWYMTVIAGFLFVMQYEVIMFLIRLSVQIMGRQPLHFTSALMRASLIEAVVHASALLVVYMVATQFSRRFGPRYV